MLCVTSVCKTTSAEHSTLGTWTAAEGRGPNKRTKDIHKRQITLHVINREQNMWTIRFTISVGELLGEHTKISPDGVVLRVINVSIIFDMQVC